jgi:uncharacterized membrane protein YkvI
MAFRPRRRGGRPGSGAFGAAVKTPEDLTMTTSIDGPVRSSWLDRTLLPGFAFKAVIIGGGYATGRELAEFFGPSGPRGGLLGMTEALLIFSVVGVLTFLFARAFGARDYRTFFIALLGPFWRLLELTMLALSMVTLSVFSAAAGVIASTTFGLPESLGQGALFIGILGFVAFGNEAVERLFKAVTILLYGVYATFLCLSLWKFGDLILAGLLTPRPMTGWIPSGFTYAGYNVVGLLVVLPVTRHLSTRNDAITAGLLCGPLAILPAMVFFLCMAALPDLGAITLPSDALLDKLHMPAFRYLFQIMIFAALLESGTGGVHTINERIAKVAQVRGRGFGPASRMGVAALLLAFTVLVAARFGLVALIASGYRYLSYVCLCLYVLPLCTIGVVRMARHGAFAKTPAWIASVQSVGRASQDQIDGRARG